MPEKKNAVVTGGSKGIGKAVVEALARRGNNVYACARRQSDEFENWLRELAETYSIQTMAVYFDLANQASMDEGLQHILADKKKIDILVNNAGTTAVGLILETSMTQLREVFEVNYFAQMYITQKIARRMLRSRGGSIVNIVSAQAQSPEAGRLVYASSKAALALATKVMAKELAPFGIRVNAVAPGAVQTDLLKNYPEKGLQHYIENSLAGRPAEAWEIASVVAFLASDEASYINGQIVQADGGRV